MKKLFTLLCLLLAVAVNGMAQDTWTVVGSHEILNGDTNWDVGNEDNNLSYLGGDADEEYFEYRLEVENCMLKKGVQYELKIVKDHNWEMGSFPDENQTFSVDESGLYDLEYFVKFDNGSCEIEITPSRIGNAYSIAGNSAALFGITWDASNTSTNMTLDGDVYKWMSEKVSLTKDDGVSFKVVENYSWTNSYGNGSEDFFKAVPVDGEYKLIITFNPESKAITATFEGESHKYIVAGSAEITNSASDWLVADANKMTVEGDVATLTFENLDLLALQTYEYKIVDQMFINGEKVGNDIWYPEGTGNNCQLSVAKSSKYNINYSFNVSTGVATATPTEQLTGYYLVRSDNNWKPSGDPLTTKQEYPDSYFAVIDNQPGLSFIVAPNTAIDAEGNIADWDACKRPTANTALGFGNFEGEYGVGGSASWTIENGAPNKNDGILTIEIQKNKWVITCNQTIPMTSAGYATYSNFYDYGIYDGTPYIVKEVGGAMKLVAVENPLHIPGGTGVVVAKKENKEKFYVFGTSGVASDVSGNLLIGSNNYDYEITGNDGVKNYTPYIFANGKNGVGFYLIKGFTGSETKTIGAHKAFLALPKGAGAREFIGFDETGEATGISASLNEKGAMTNEKVFNLSGQRVSQPTKGLYIVNGKKFVK